MLPLQLALLLLLGVCQALGLAAAQACSAKLYDGSCFHCTKGPSRASCTMAGSTKAATVAECCAACAANAQCDLFTLQLGTGMCYMKTAAGAAVPTACDNATSGRLTAKPTPAPPSAPPAPTPLPAGRARSSFKNVLFIAVDDLRPEIKAYGHSFMHTPHLDKFVRLHPIHFAGDRVCAEAGSPRADRGCWLAEMAGIAEHTVHARLRPVQLLCAVSQQLYDRSQARRDAVLVLHGPLPRKRRTFYPISR